MPCVDDSQFTEEDWSSFYKDAQEVIPLNAPEPLGNEVLVSCFLHADHAGNHLTQKSHTDILNFLQSSPPPSFGVPNDKARLKHFLLVLNS